MVFAKSTSLGWRDDAVTDKDWLCPSSRSTRKVVL
jgi:hypothetical protein